MSRVLRIFRMNPIKLVDEPERFMNRHGRLFRLSRHHEISHLVRGSQRKNGSAQLLIIFNALVDLRRYAKQDLRPSAKDGLTTLLNLSLRSASTGIGLHPCAG
jgi:hypothetical protein